MKLIKPEIVNAITPDQVLREKLSESMGVSKQTIYMWLIANSPRLTMATARETISEHTGISSENLITDGRT